MRWIRLVIVILPALFLSSAAQIARALDRTQIVLVVNRNVPEGEQLAQFYAKARNIPPNHIVSVSLPAAEEISFQQYERDVAPPIRAFLLRNHLDEQTTCLVTFYGMPLRIGSRQLTADDRKEVEQLKRDMVQLRPKISPVVDQLEDMARSLDPSFNPVRQDDLDALARRADQALQVVGSHLPAVQDPQRRAELIGRIVQVMQALGGVSNIAERFGASELKNPNLPDEQREKWKLMIQQVQQGREEAQRLQWMRYDPQARDKSREMAPGLFGLLGYARLLEGQLEYFQTTETVAALDSELSLLWWGYYNRSRWVRNPLNFKFEVAGAPKTLMVMRLDGPQSGTARDIIVSSLKAERDGLSGKVVIDSRGIPRIKDGRIDGYGEYDQTLRDLSEIIRTKTSLKQVLDTHADVLAANTVQDVAIYCGWYSLQHYVPACSFVPGAVGYHIASLELVTLHQAKGSGWVRGLLEDGIAATMGAVAEPYLVAFPPADEFFPLLFTGKLTLAEVYWKTQLTSSWMISMIGDPLYNPYKNHPALKVEDLPDPLRKAVIGLESQPQSADIQASGPSGR
jgi:uncharacterized protein (TIGR03790 family)